MTECLYNELFILWNTSGCLTIDLNEYHKEKCKENINKIKIKFKYE